MAVSDQHPGPMRMENVRACSVDYGLTLFIDPDYEIRRLRFMQPLLNRYARLFTLNSPYPRGMYPTFDPLEGCHCNAVRLATEFPELIYHEGFMGCTGPEGELAMAHAFCVTRSGYVVDPSAPDKASDPRVVYAGIPIRTDYMHAMYGKFGWFGVLDGHPTLGKTVGIYADDPSKWLVDY